MAEKRSDHIEEENAEETGDGKDGYDLTLCLWLLLLAWKCVLKAVILQEELFCLKECVKVGVLKLCNFNEMILSNTILWLYWLCAQNHFSMTFWQPENGKNAKQF